MTTIRPNLYPQTQPRPDQQDSAKLAAQRAFFNAALGQAQAPSASAAPQAPVATQTAAAAPAAPRAAAAPQEQGQQRILRPGSLIDIRI